MIVLFLQTFCLGGRCQSGFTLTNQNYAHVSAPISSFLSPPVWYKTFPPFFNQTAPFGPTVFTPTPDNVCFAGYGTVWCQQLDRRPSTERADGLSYGSNAVPLIRHTPNCTQLFGGVTVFESIFLFRVGLGRYILRVNLKITVGFAV